MQISILFQGIEMSDFAKQKLEVTGKELLEEKDEALQVCEAAQ